MPRHERHKSKTGFYHIMMRGNERKNIFIDDEDRLRFLETLDFKKLENKYELYAFCIMDNHVHLLVSEGTEDIANIMKRINISYAIYFNKKYKRIGHLFQDRFRSEAIDDYQQLIAVTRYIHQNPLKAGMVKTVEEYTWSSIQWYLNQTVYLKDLINTEMILGMFSTKEEEAKKQFLKYMNKESNEKYLDITEPKDKMDKNEARKLYEKILEEGKGVKKQDEILKEFKRQSGLTIREIAEITGINKDKICRLVKN